MDSPSSLTAECTCPLEASGPWDCTQCPAHGADAIEELNLMHQDEIAAENAWLYHAENTYYDPREPA